MLNREFEPASAAVLSHPADLACQAGLSHHRAPSCTVSATADCADLFIYDEAQQEAALSDLAILGALLRKCLVLRLDDPKQTSTNTGPSDLARRVR